MNSIEEIAIDTYNKNILYIMQNHPELATDLQNLDLAIEQNIYEEQYALEYINDNFDIKILKTNNYFYDTTSNEFAKSVSKQINYTKSEGTIEGFSVYDVTKLNIDNQESIDDKKEVYELMKYTLNNSNTTDKMKKIKKFIFVGVGLGLHITTIDAKIKASDYLIIEDNLEIFKLSLFTTKYYEIGQRSRIVFSILEDDSVFTKKIELFLVNNFAYNRFFKYVSMNSHSNTKIRLIQTAIANQSFSTFPYHRRLNMTIKPLEYLKENYKFLNLSEHIKSDFFHDKPILVLAAGPSFKDNLEWLVQNHSHYIIIAVSAVLPTLYKHAIKPDIITHLDGVEETTVFYEGYDAKEYLKDAICIFSAMTPKKIINILNKEQIYFYENITNYHKGFAVPISECVGSFSYIFSTLINAKETFLLGLDLALNQKTGETHSGEHSENKTVDLHSSDEINTKTSLVDTTLKVQGNTSKTVLTNAVLYSSVISLDRVIPQIVSNGQSAYNFSNGSKLANASALNILECQQSKVIDKSNLYKNIHSALTESSTSKLSPLDIQSLQLELEAVLRMRTYVEEFKKTHNSKDVDKYINNLINLIITILQEKTKENNSTLTEVYYDYFQYVLALLDDFFNTVGTNNTKHHIKKMNKIIESGLDSIQDKYENALTHFYKSN